MLTIVNATANDGDILARFQEEMALESENLRLDPIALRKGVKAIFDDPAKGFYLLAKEDANIVGCLLVTSEWSEWRNKTVYWIQSVYVVPEARRKGVFRKMYEEVKNRVSKNENLGGIRLYVDKSNTRAQEVYRKIGMNDQHYSYFEWMKDF
ncbi:MAG: GNAT family N-acetyltransferase [Lentimicrobiaceae bacterium]|jgi:ribosomal protein S18 acetylase RimI-like enzyme|nr:GNAT family N-acetyltransferase [Lentimicrobiaceae bacterium]